MTVTAIVTCTACGVKFSHSSDRYDYGELASIKCPDGHLSKDILSKTATMECNSEKSYWSEDAIKYDPSDDGDPEPELVAA